MTRWTKELRLALIALAAVVGMLSVAADARANGGTSARRASTGSCCAKRVCPAGCCKPALADSRPASSEQPAAVLARTVSLTDSLYANAGRVSRPHLLRRRNRKRSKAGRVRIEPSQMAVSSFLPFADPWLV